MYGPINAANMTNFSAKFFFVRFYYYMICYAGIDIFS